MKNFNMSDLRLGNLLLEKDSHLPVTVMQLQINIDDKISGTTIYSPKNKSITVYSSITSKNAMPVVVTKKVLEGLGAEKCWTPYVYRIPIDLESQSYIFIYKQSGTYMCSPINQVEVRYVHQLQNLVKVLYNKELDISRLMELLDEH